MTIKMHQIAYFLALCEERNFTRAARRCGVTQPSLTRAIQQLEAELGGQLFDRNTSCTSLTALGALIRPEFVRINQATQDIISLAATSIRATLNSDQRSYPCEPQ